jgi:CheY-like chemotaxis protein
VVADSTIEADSVPRCRVLVVDDDRDVGDSFAGLLESLGQDVTVVYSASEALQAVQNQEPRVAFIDLAMPGIDGWELARRLRRQSRDHELAIIAVTGHGKSQANGTFQDFDHHLLKPVSRETIIEMLSAIADKETPA